MDVRKITPPDTKVTPEFDSDEHEHIKVVTPDFPDTRIMLPNQMQLRFNQIIALSGDYFGKDPICQGDTESEREKRFLAAFNTLGYAKRSEINSLLDMFKEQGEYIKDARKRGLPESVGIREFAMKETLKAVIDTKGKFIHITSVNFDHFGDNALLAHHTGHQLALRAAARAHHLSGDARARELNLAYAYEAFACHFFSDRFATGHIRTPRYPLYDFNQTVGGLLALFMHDEDNYTGLNVTNKNGDAWRAYGDAHYFENYNIKTRKNLEDALNALIKEVHDAFENGYVVEKDDVLKNSKARRADYSPVYKYIPEPVPIPTPYPPELKDKDNPDREKYNSVPLFLNDPIKGCITYRTNLDNVYDADRAELTWSSALRILAHFTLKYTKEGLQLEGQDIAYKLKPFEQFIQDKIAELEKAAKKDAESVASCLKNLSIFKWLKKDRNPPDPTPQQTPSPTK